MHACFLTTSLLLSITEAIIYFQSSVDKSVKRPLPNIIRIMSKLYFAVEFCIPSLNRIPCAKISLNEANCKTGYFSFKSGYHTAQP